MSLLDELRTLDVADIVSARGSISVSVNTPAMNAVVGSGAASSALGGFGASLDTIRGSFPDAKSLLSPLMESLQRLGGSIDPGDLPLDDYVAAVREGMEFIVRMVRSVGGDASSFGDIFGTPLAEAMRVVGDRAGQMSGLFGGAASGYADLARVASGDVRDPRALADLAADILLPFPKANLRSMHESVGLVLSASASLQLPAGRATGLAAALDAVALAAEAGDRAALDAALRNLRQVRTHMLGILRDDLQFAIQQVNGLRVPQLMQPLTDFSRTLKLGEQGVIEFLDDFRQIVAAVRAEMENPDLARVRAFLQTLAPIIEERARLSVEVPIDNSVIRAQEFVRRTLRQLPVRDLRNQLTRYLQDLVKVIDDANLDGPAEATRGALAEISARLDPGALTGEVQAALQAVNGTITGAIDGVIDALDTIQQRVDALAATAEGILGRLADGLAQFKAAIDAVSGTIDALGIEQIEQQLVEALSTLRETASELLANVPLPEPLKPQVEQLIELLEGVDFDAVFEPVRDVVAELRIPDDVAGVVEAGLQEAKKVVDNLIPASLIASIEAEVNKALDTVRSFNPASLLPDVSQYLEEAAGLIESLDPRPIAEQIGAPFQTVLDAVDRVHPNRVLAPVIEAYDSLLAQVPVPNAETAVRGVRGAFDSAGRVAGRAVMEPARQAAGGGADSEVADPESRTPTSELPPPASEVRAGDAIRLLGFIPSRLRELLGSIEAGPAGQVLEQVDQLCGGLARELRQVQTALHEAGRRIDAGLEGMLIPLGPSQVRAHLAIQANFSGEVGFQASLDTVVSAGPAAMRRELAGTIAALRSTTQSAAASAGGALGASIERMAVALEQSPMARIGGQLDALLAALDVEPIAADLDALVDRMIAITPQLVAGLLPDLRLFVERMKAIINHYNPGAQAQKFLAVIDVVREELDVLDPRRLAAELGELHAIIRATIAAYDPRAFAEEIAALTRTMAQRIRGLNPAELLGDLNFLQAAVDRVAQANPATRLAAVGASLTMVGERLAGIDLDALIEAVNQLGPRLLDSFQALIEAVRSEIVALLESLRFAMAEGSASVSVSASISVG
jgi:phage-related protein